MKTALIAAHGLALSAAWLSAAPLAAKVLLGLVIPVHLLLAVKNHHRQHRRIRYSTASGWDVDGETVSVQPSTVVTPYAIWLHYQTLTAEKKALLILHDALPDAEFRRLIVKLKISAS